MSTVSEDSDLSVNSSIDSTKQYKLEMCGYTDSLIIYKNENNKVWRICYCFLKS